MDVLEKPVVDDLITIEFNGNTVEQCSHSQHGHSRNHEGDAAWWQESKCPACDHYSRGYRCDKFVKCVAVQGGVFCSNCYYIMKTPFIIFTPLGD